jgi:hypothetical protein
VTITSYAPHNIQSAKDIMNINPLYADTTQNDDYTFDSTGIKSHLFTAKTLGIAEQMDENVCLVEFFGYNEKPLNTGSFISRGSLQNLAEIIIGNGLAVGSRYITVLRNRKSGQAMPKSHDMQLIRHLLSGLCILETTLLDYIIIGEGTIFSANEAGMLENKGQRSMV